MLFLFSCFPLVTLSLANSDRNSPLSLEWSTTKIGAEGPWNAISMDVEGQKMAMYGARKYETIVLSDKYCDYNQSSDLFSSFPDNCFPKVAGVLPNASEWSDYQLTVPFPAKFIQLGTASSGSDMERGLVTMDISNSQQIYYQTDKISTGIAEDQWIVMPNSLRYPPAAGCLGLGADKDMTQTFSLGADDPKVGQLPAAQLYNETYTPSYSYTMHLGSATGSQVGQMEGSFIVGGYDQNRLVGDAMSYDGDLSLRDIAIETVDGGSPFNSSANGNITGLLIADNSSMPAAVSVEIDGCSPFLSLAKSTCDAIASHLPVKYLSDFALYQWDTSDPLFEKITSSPTTLSFVFMDGGNAKNLTIRIPFMHLNLTLSAPYVSESIQYFPCYAGLSNNGYVLGRAFLQDAVIGNNFLNGSVITWLAQGAGPRIQTSKKVITLNPTATSLEAGENDWKESWDGVWTALPGGPTTLTPTATDIPSDKKPMSTSTKVIICIVCVLATVSISGIAFWLWRRHKKKQKMIQKKIEVQKSASDVSDKDFAEKPMAIELHEVDGTIKKIPWPVHGACRGAIEMPHHNKPVEMPHHTDVPIELPCITWHGPPVELPT